MTSGFRSFLLPVLAIAALTSACRAEPGDDAKPDKPASPPPASTDKMETATLAAGCFWCVEAVLQRIEGVHKVDSGYMGGHVKNPTYRQVCTGTTGHAEVVQVVFDPSVLPYEKLVQLFFELHDPTTLNRQGADTGTQYRSAIFYHSDAQKAAAEKVKDELTKAGRFKDPIVTEITKASEFYVAEDYHQDYFNRNREAGYCNAVIWPKLRKLGLDTKPTVTRE